MESENASKRSLRGTKEKKPSATDRYIILSVVVCLFFYENSPVKFIFKEHFQSQYNLFLLKKVFLMFINELRTNF